MHVCIDRYIYACQYAEDRKERSKGKDYRNSFIEFIKSIA